MPDWQWSRSGSWAASGALLWWLGAAFAVGWLVFGRLVQNWPYGLTRSPRCRAGAGPAVAHAGRRRGLRCAARPRVPEAELWWLAWFALVPWLIVVRRAPSAREAAIRGWWGAVGFLLAVHYWLLPSTTFFLPVLAAVVAMLWLPWAVLTWWLLADPLSRTAGVRLRRSWSRQPG